MFQLMGEFSKTGSYNFRPFVEDQERLDNAAKLARRKRSEVSRMLLQRALDLFERDFKIAENLPPVIDPKEKGTHGERVPKGFEKITGGRRN